MNLPATGPSPIVALVLGWIIPGAGHAYAGRWGKAVLFFVCITGLLVAGMVMSGGTAILWDLYLLAQGGAGGPAFALIPISDHFAKSGVDWANRLHETGRLYTAVAGFLNILVMMDAYLKLAYPHAGTEKEAE